MRGKIILSSDVLHSQSSSLARHSQTLSHAAATAPGAMPATAFGRLNMFLPGPCNDLARGSRDLLKVASEALAAMEKGVKGVLESFADIEDKASSKIGQLEP